MWKERERERGRMSMKPELAKWIVHENDSVTERERVRIRENEEKWKRENKRFSDRVSG